MIKGISNESIIFYGKKEKKISFEIIFVTDEWVFYIISFFLIFKLFIWTSWSNFFFIFMHL